MGIYHQHQAGIAAGLAQTAVALIQAGKAIAKTAKALG
jgi:hypothetical protein